MGVNFFLILASFINSNRHELNFTSLCAQGCNGETENSLQDNIPVWLFLTQNTLWGINLPSTLFNELGRALVDFKQFLAEDYRGSTHVSARLSTSLPR